jgi:hypothetical protein
MAIPPDPSRTPLFSAKIGERQQVDRRLAQGTQIDSLCDREDADSALLSNVKWR